MGLWNVEITALYRSAQRFGVNIEIFIIWLVAIAAVIVPPSPSDIPSPAIAVCIDDVSARVGLFRTRCQKRLLIVERPLVATAGAADLYDIGSILRGGLSYQSNGSNPGASL